MKKLLSEFKSFAVKGNVMDMAIGVMIGAAFGKIVTSVVNDLLMPLVSLLIGKIDFSNLFIALDGNKYSTLEEAQAAGVAIFNYGNFIQTTVDFLILAIIIFFMIKLIVKAGNRNTKTTETTEIIPTPTICPYCKTEISPEATRCPHCTSELTAQKTA